MTSSVQSNLLSERCLNTRQCPLQLHVFFEDLGVVAWRERSGPSHASTRPEKLDRGAGADSRVEESAVEAQASTCCGACPALSDEASVGAVRAPG